METYVGHVKTPADAIVLFEACRLGQLPRVQRRLSEKERMMIKSGSVFVWDEREAGMRRWTDGKSWSASRVNGSFLTYREMEGKKGAGGFPSAASSLPRPQRVSPTQEAQDPDNGAGDAPDGYRYRPDGLTKQSFSITTSQGQHLHLISYFSRSDLNSSRLMLPSQDPNLRHIRPAKGMYPESTLQDNANTPALTRSPMVGAHYAGSPQHSAASTPQYAQPRAFAHAYSPAFSWSSPSPMHTPPSSGSTSIHYSPYSSGRPGPLGHPPIYPPTSIPPHHAHVGSGPTAFDNVPPPLGSSAMPPPPALNQPHANGYAPQLPPTSAPAQHYSTTSPYSHPMPPQRYSPPHNQLPPFRGTHSPHSSTADPRRGPEDASTHSDNSPRVKMEPRDADKTPPRSAAGTIPSINSLINKSPTLHHVDSRPPPLVHRSSLSNKRPGESNLGGYPEKKPYTEDTRALRQLDRAFAL